MPAGKKGVRMAKWRHRVVLSLLLILGLPVPAGAQSEDGVLQKVVIVSRHGVRTPTIAESELANWAAQPWPTWQEPPGYLTAHGARLVTQLGRFYRHYL